MKRLSIVILLLAVLLVPMTAMASTSLNFGLGLNLAPPPVVAPPPPVYAVPYPPPYYYYPATPYPYAYGPPAPYWSPPALSFQFGWGRWGGHGRRWR